MSQQRIETFGAIGICKDWQIPIDVRPVLLLKLNYLGIKANNNAMGLFFASLYIFFIFFIKSLNEQMLTCLRD